MNPIKNWCFQINFVVSKFFTLEICLANWPQSHDAMFINI
jgi:hypothetical protein